MTADVSTKSASPVQAACDKDSLKRPIGSPSISTESSTSPNSTPSSLMKHRSTSPNVRQDTNPAHIAERALRSLLGPSPHAATAARAASTLESLNARLAAQARMLGRLAELEEIVMKERTQAQEATQNIEQDIIEAKLSHASLLEEKDSVSRNLAMARRELTELNEFASATSEQLSSTAAMDALPGVSSSTTAPTSTVSGNSQDLSNYEAEEQRIEMLELQANADLAALRDLDDEIVAVTDEIDKIQKQRKQLQKKFSDAYDDL